MAQWYRYQVSEEAVAVTICNVPSRYNWWQCGGDIRISSAVPQDMNNKYEYPIHLGKPLQIVTQANNPTHTYDKLNNVGLEESHVYRFILDNLRLGVEDEQLWMELSSYFQHAH